MKLQLLPFLRFFLLSLTISIISKNSSAQQLIFKEASPAAFPLGQSLTIYTDPREDSLVQKVSRFFAEDLTKVTGKTYSISLRKGGVDRCIVIGTLQNSAFIRDLIESGKLDVRKIRGKWEAYQVQVIKNPSPGIEEILVFAGSDARGLAYGVFELSRQAGVSPWNWWADVPVKKSEALYAKAGISLIDSPRVQYRGIFINDEAPALSNWSREKFGGFNHRFYSKVFELMLRLKANYIWPAMWGNAFYDDDSLNLKTASEYGIVIGTSHHEPLMRAHDEWRRYGKGKWNYDSNKLVLQDFWKKGMQRASNEKIVTIGMRGDGDEPMSSETATALLERIVADQRKIISETTGKPANQTPQLWALYKEVQDYYDKGMRVPDDVTLLLCDDNWGNIRRLPKPGSPKRKGGYGIYYHFDYVGGPRNYKWLNTNNISRVWEQMHLAWEHDVRKIWIVNVGDIKPMELPISFFLDYAWNPMKWNEENIPAFYSYWAGDQFGADNAEEIGSLLKTYAQLSARRKPELLDANTYKLHAYREADIVLEEWNKLEKKTKTISAGLPTEYKDAFFQLVEHPIIALSNLHKLYYAVALNQYFAADKLGNANLWADSARKLYEKDSFITIQYHNLGRGKWNHMMSQTHIGYTYWQQPETNRIPALQYVSNPVKPYESISEGVSDSFDQGSTDQIPKGAQGNIFYELNGVVSMEAEHFSRKKNGSVQKWKVIPGIGRTGSGVTTFPANKTAINLASSPLLEYDFYTYSTGETKLKLYFSPTLSFYGKGLQYAVAVDNEAPRIYSLNLDANNVAEWEKWVAQNIVIQSSNHSISKKGGHTIKYWALSPGLILQKLVLDLGGEKESYLGPPETLFIKERGVWNGKKAAVVLTYDDALNEHLSIAIPALDSVGLKGTFYLSDYFGGLQAQVKGWRTAAGKGHELANHTIHHPCLGHLPGRSFVRPETDLNNYSFSRLISEIKAMNTLLHAIDGKTERTFAFPCGDAKIRDSAYIPMMPGVFLSSRAVRAEMYTPDQVNLDDVGSYMFNGETAEQLIALVKQAKLNGRLLVLLFHGVGGGHGLNISKEEHSKFLSYLKKNKEEVWIAPLIDVAKFLKNKN